MKILFSFFVIVFFAVPICMADELIPQQIEWEGRTYDLAPWDDRNKSVVYGDFDGDGEEEAIVNFRVVEEGDTDIQFPHVFHIIYDDVDSHPRIVKTIKSIDERLDKVLLIDLPDKQGKSRKTIAIFGSGGNHYTALEIYQYRNGDYGRIFVNGSACPVEIKEDADPLQIWVGRANWEKEGWCYADLNYLWQVYNWDGERFNYSDELSTCIEITEEQELSRFIAQFRDKTEDLS